MPNLDKTGPRGEGPTGWGRGGCADTPRANTSGQGLGLGLGKGRGARRQMTLQEEEALLKARLEEIKKEKEARSE